MNCSLRLSKWRGSFRYRLSACVAVGLVWHATLAPMAAASMPSTAGTDRAPPARNVVAPPNTSADGAVSQPATGLAPKERVASANDSVPQLWTPRAAVVVDASSPLGAESLFDGDAATGLTLDKGGSGSVRLQLGSARDVMGLAVRGRGRAKLAIYGGDDKGARKLTSTGGDVATNLEAEHWVQLTPVSPTR